MSKRIFEVKSRPRPPEVRTLREFIAWRAAEDARMIAEGEAKLAAYIQALENAQCEKFALEAEGRRTN